MTQRFTGDLEPPLIIELSAPDAAVDISTATAVRVIGRDDTRNIIFDRAPTDTEVTGDISVVTMNLQSGDTDERGAIQVEVEVMWPGNRPQTFRPFDVLDVVTDFDIEDIP